VYPRPALELFLIRRCGRTGHGKFKGPPPDSDKQFLWIFCTFFLRYGPPLHCSSRPGSKSNSKCSYFLQWRNIGSATGGQKQEVPPSPSPRKVTVYASLMPTVVTALYVSSFISKAVKIIFSKRVETAGLPSPYFMHFYTTVIRPILQYASPLDSGIRGACIVYFFQKVCIQIHVTSLNFGK